MRTSGRTGFRRQGSVREPIGSKDPVHVVGQMRGGRHVVQQASVVIIGQTLTS